VAGKFRRPCLVCSALTDIGETYCPQHLKELKQTKEIKRSQDPARRARKAALYDSAYRRKRKEIIDYVRAYGFVCYLCKKEIQIDQAIDIDHVTPGDTNSELLPTHASCNRSKGSKPATH